jgi:DNA/RNA endonuclease YhcR with UshA esterase domain
LLYQRWNPASELRAKNDGRLGLGDENQGGEAQTYRVSFAPLSLPLETQAEHPVLQAREVDKIRALSGTQARVRGRVFRVGHSGKSNTYFLNFGPSRGALTAVIFASAAELFERQKLQPKTFEGKEIEIVGEIKDHPQYGLELILEDPAQVKILN